MTAYYNEFDPYAAQWLRNLIAAGHIAPGVVDERSIEEVSADDLKGFTQAHFFAGIGGWSLSARLAGWPDDRPLWTGSCPCQPFSAAGQRKGESDERHLWPVFFKLIKECRPSAVAGEQVASKLGYEWLTGVRSDLESEGYAVGAVDLCAASVGAPHIRQRMWWMAYPGRFSDECGRGLAEAQSAHRQTEGERNKRERSGPDSGRSGSSGRMADAESPRQQAWTSDRMGAKDQSRWNKGQLESEGGPVRMDDSHGLGRGKRAFTERSAEAGAGGEKAQWSNPRAAAWGGRDVGRLGNPDGEGLEKRESNARLRSEETSALAGEAARLSSHWDGVYISCADGKARRIEPSIEPLAHGVSNRVGRLRAYGNAIVPQVGAEVLKAFMLSRF